MQDSVLKKRIMRRVYFVYYAKRVLSPLAIKFYLGAVILGGILSTVSVTSVFRNIPSFTDFGALSYFSKYAFMHTELTVQVLLVGGLAFSLFVARELLKSRGVISFSRA